MYGTMLSFEYSLKLAITVDLAINDLLGTRCEQITSNLRCIDRALFKNRRRVQPAKPQPQKLLAHCGLADAAPPPLLSQHKQMKLRGEAPRPRKMKLAGADWLLGDHRGAHGALAWREGSPMKLHT